MKIVRHGKSVEHDMNVCAAGLVPQIRIFLKLNRQSGKRNYKINITGDVLVGKPIPLPCALPCDLARTEKNGPIRNVFLRRLSTFRQRHFGVQIIAPLDYAVLTFRSDYEILIRGVVVEYASRGIFVQ